MSGTPQSFASDSPCFSERSCAATTLGNQSSALEKGCELTRAANCADIKDQDKLYTCSVKTFCAKTDLDTAIAGVKGCGMGFLSGTGLKAIGETIGALAAYAASNSKGCNSDIEQKLDMIDKFNDSLPPGESFKTPPEQSLQRMSCSDLLSQFRTKADLVTQRMIAKSQADVSKEINPARKAQVSFKEQAEKILNQFKVRRECYNTEALAELYCEAGTVAALTVAGGYGAFRSYRLAKLADLSKSVQVEAVVAASIRSAGGATEGLMATASSLSNADRLGVAKTLLGRTLSKAEQDAIIAAHNLGKGREGAGFFTYTEQELRDKARILRRAGFNSKERDILMRNGITGSSADSSAIQKSMAETKTYKTIVRQEQEKQAKLPAAKRPNGPTGRLLEIAKVFKNRDEALQQVESQSYRSSTMTGPEKLQYLRSVKALADATRVAGETAASVGDLKSGQALIKEAAARLEKVAQEAPQLMSSSRDREALMELKMRAGDIDGAAKTFVENAKADSQSLSERFQQLKESAEAERDSVKYNNESGTARNLGTGNLLIATNPSSAYFQQMQELRTLDKILESKPPGLNVDFGRERARIQSLIDGAKRALKNRGYDPDNL